MALTSTIYTFDIELSDIDRGVYETLALRVPRHPSESAEYFVTRLVAYCREYADGIAFSRGLSDPDEPTLAVRDLTGAVTTWVEIGAPDAARLHKASKTGARVAVYTHKDPRQLVRNWSGTRIHRVEALEVYSLDASFVADLTSRLDRRMELGVTIADGTVLAALGAEAISGTLTRVTLDSP